MRKGRMAAGLLVSCLLLGGAGAVRSAPPTVAEMLSLRPTQEGIVYTTPTAQEEGQCKVEANKWGRTGSGWLLRDPQGRPLRRFYNTRFTSPGDGSHIDYWCYYKDGVEVYREWASKNGARPDNFRWMNGGGTKWGVDENKDGKIDVWKMISPEEVSQEVLKAVAGADFARLQALMITDAEIKALELPAAEATRIRGLHNGAATKFQATLKKVSLDSKVNWLHLETAAPHCLLAEQTGAHQDIVRHAGGTILYEQGGKTDGLQLGELIQVGQTWRLVDAPTPGMAVEVASQVGPGGAISTPVTDKELQALLDQLKEMESGTIPPVGPGGPNPAVVRYQLQRADLLEKIETKVKPEDRDPWIRQVADCLSTAAQNSPATDKTALRRLQSLEQQVTGAIPGSNLAAYVAFRALSADYAIQIAETKNFEQVQKAWLDKLAGFVKTYQSADDTPDALQQLGMISELMGKEIEAKNWYQQLVGNFADKPQGLKARGAVRRLELEGKPLELTGPALGTGTAFDITRLRGKVVAVYYWASWNNQCPGDFAKLKVLLETYGSKGFELVGVNLDSSTAEASQFLKSYTAPGLHLYKEGGMESPLATQYGIMVLPNLFLVDKDGKVLSRTLQVGTLEDELKKLLK